MMHLTFSCACDPWLTNLWPDSAPDTFFRSVRCWIKVQDKSIKNPLLTPLTDKKGPEENLTEEVCFALGV